MALAVPVKPSQPLVRLAENRLIATGAAIAKEGHGRIVYAQAGTARVRQIMKSRSQIVEGGGWLIRRAVGRPRARFFGTLSLLWLCVSLPASIVFWHGWPESFGGWHWLCSGLMVPQPVIALLAAGFLLKERPRLIVEHVANRDCDILKLY